MIRITARLGAALFTAALVGFSGPATAHIGVSSPDATPGGDATVVFHVEAESPTASVTKVVVTFPQETPFAEVGIQSKPGWTAEESTEKLDKPTKVGDFNLTEAVRTVTWTADGKGIAPSQYDEFIVTVSPLPTSGEVVFNASETYDDGTVAAWDQLSKGGEEPEYPAPVLSIDDTDQGTSAVSSNETSDETDSRAPLWISVGALVVATVALVVALRQNRRRA